MLEFFRKKTNNEDEVIENQEETKKEKKIKKFWTDEEMEKFDKELEEYKQDFVSVKNKRKYRTVLIGGRYKYFQDREILSVGWRINWENVKSMSDFNFIVRKPNKYTELSRKFEFYLNWKQFQKLGSFGL